MPQHSSKHFIMEVFYRTFSGGLRPSTCYNSLMLRIGTKTATILLLLGLAWGALAQFAGNPAGLEESIRRQMAACRRSSCPEEPLLQAGLNQILKMRQMQGNVVSETSRMTGMGSALTGYDKLIISRGRVGARWGLI